MHNDFKYQYVLIDEAAQTVEPVRAPAHVPLASTPRALIHAGLRASVAGMCRPRSSRCETASAAS